MQIGQELKCSMCGELTNHCVHTLFVMIKKLKVSSESPIAHQVSYLDSEIGDIIAGKYSDTKKQNIQKKEFLHAHSKYKGKSAPKPGRSADFDLQQNRKPVTEEICPICQNEVRNSYARSF